MQYFSVVKSTVKIVSKLVVAYFVALPLLFGLHAKDHQHSNLEAHSDETELRSECSLCDLYHTQTAVEAIQLQVRKANFFTEVEKHYCEVLVCTSAATNFLRGPPNA